MLKKIISGGQTGADQGALDAAISLGFPYGGAIPSGRKTETGPLPHSYRMEVLESGNYSDRTERNVVEADGTLIMSHGPLTGGSALTEKIAVRLGKPCLHIDFTLYDIRLAAEKTSAWLEREQVSLLNVAGPRASTDGRIYQLSRELIMLLMKEDKGGDIGA